MTTLVPLGPRPRRRTLLVILLGTAIAGLATLGVGCDLARQHDQPPNFLVIVVDTLRADRLGAYGNTRGLTPFIDSLADRGYVFKNAYAASSWTFPSVASLLTARSPQQHGVVDWESILTEGEITFAEVLGEAGYETVAFQANALVTNGLGWAQGFDHYKTYPVQTELVDGKKAHPRTFHERAVTLNADALDHMRSRMDVESDAGPFLLYMQYMEPHYPWRPTPASLAYSFGDDEVPDLASINSTFFLARPMPPSQAFWALIARVYDAAVRDLDEQLRIFFDELESMRALDNTYIILVSDHGEQLGEHGGLAAHGISLFNQEIHVPLIVVPPGHQDRIDVTAVFSLIDVGPTIVSLAGIDPPSTFAGRSFEAVLSDRSAEPDPNEGRGALSSLLAQVPDKMVADYQGILHHFSYVRETIKLIESNDGNLSVYRLEDDPEEARPLEFDERHAALEEAYRAARDAAGLDVAPTESRPVSPEMLERLKALGYAQ